MTRRKEINVRGGNLGTKATHHHGPPQKKAVVYSRRLSSEALGYMGNRVCPVCPCASMLHGTLLDAPGAHINMSSHIKISSHINMSSHIKMSGHINMSNHLHISICRVI